MKLNLTPLLARARKVQTLKPSPSLTVTVIDDVVDAVTGEPTEVAADLLRGLDVSQAATLLHALYAGDAAFVVQSPQAFGVVRPAFSELPVFYWPRDDRIDVWSGLEVPAIVQQSPPGFDLDYLDVALRNWSWMTPRTGLRGVWELLGGAVLFFDGRDLHQRDLLAQAVRNLPHGLGRDYDDDVAAIRRLTLNSVRHKLGPHLDHASVLCSGGVDSSVGAVAAKLLYPTHKLPLLHCFSVDHLGGDERFYFEAVAARTGWPAATADMHMGASREDLSPELLVPTARPLKSGAALSTMAKLKGMAQDRGARVMLSGDGGDQLFILNDPLLYSREVLGEARTPAAALRSVSALASMARTTAWAVAGEAVREKRAARLRERFFGAKRFPANPLVANDVTPDLSVAPNGALLSPLGISRVFQFFGMRNAELNHVPVKGYAVDERKTFVFWPVIRAAMMASRGHHLRHGRDRALERDAFRAELPPEVYYRVGKGSGRDFTDKYDFGFFLAALQKSPLVRYGLISEQIGNMEASEVDDDTAFALVVARGFADWMELYEGH